MAYTPYYSGGWQSGEEGGTPITPAALNNMESGISAALEASQSTNANQLFGTALVINNSANTTYNGKRVLMMLTNNGMLVWNTTDSVAIWRMELPLSVTLGGTGGTTAAEARTNIGAAAIGDIVTASGTYEFGQVPAGTATSATVQIGTTQRDANYMVLTEPLTGNITVGVQSKTTTSFALFIRNVATTQTSGTVRWAIIKLP